MLVGAGFSHDKRVAALAELEEHARSGLIERGRDGRWRQRQATPAISTSQSTDRFTPTSAQMPDVLVAASASYVLHTVVGEDEGVESETRIAPAALLRYWRSALRADPRGATTQVADKHGVEWALISGRGPLVPGADQALTVTIDLEAIDPAFREGCHETGSADRHGI